MTAKSWTIPIDSEGLMTFPEELIKEMGWEDGTVLAWDYTPDGTIKLSAVNPDAQGTVSPESES